MLICTVIKYLLKNENICIYYTWQCVIYNYLLILYIYSTRILILVLLLILNGYKFNINKFIIMY